MAREAFQAVQDAEEKAKEMIAQARIDAKRIVEEARLEAEAGAAQKLSEANDEASRLKAIAMQEGEEIAAPQLDKASKEAKSFIDTKDGALKEAVGFVVERVKAYGNS